MSIPFVRSAAAAMMLGAATLRGQAGDSSYSLVVGRLTRHYVLHRPRASQSRGGALPLVVLLHGRGGSGLLMQRKTEFNAIADSVGALVAYPDGFRRSWNDGRPGTPANMSNVDDVAFISAMLDDIARRAPVDPRRVYVAGHSNGGFMAERLACQMPGRFAAVGVVSATFGEWLAGSCHPAAVVSLEYFNGTKDPLVPFDGGRMGDRGVAQGARATVARWVGWNRCTGAPAVHLLPDLARDGTSVTERRYTTCDAGTEVIAYEVDGGGHEWPGAGQTAPDASQTTSGARQTAAAPRRGSVTHNVDASLELWRFFQRHRR